MSKKLVMNEELEKYRKFILKFNRLNFEGQIMPNFTQLDDLGGEVFVSIMHDKDKFSSEIDDMIKIYRILNSMYYTNSIIEFVFSSDDLRFLSLQYSKENGFCSNLTFSETVRTSLDITAELISQLYYEIMHYSRSIKLEKTKREYVKEETRNVFIFNVELLDERSRDMLVKNLLCLTREYPTVGQSGWNCRICGKPVIDYVYKMLPRGRTLHYCNEHAGEF